MCTDVQAITSASLHEVWSVVQDSVRVVKGLLGTLMSLSCQTSLRLQGFKTNTIWLFCLHCSPATLKNAYYFFFLSRSDCNNYITFKFHFANKQCKFR